MKTVRHQGHRVSHVAHDNLHEKEERRQPHHRQQATLFTRELSHFLCFCVAVDVDTAGPGRGPFLFYRAADNQRIGY